MQMNDNPATLSMIWAQSYEGVIGYQGKIPWHLPAELAHFKDCTLGAAVVMGRKTFESLAAPLSNRLNIVVSASLACGRGDSGVYRVSSLRQAFQLCRELKRKPWVIGGGDIYTACMPYAGHLVISILDYHGQGDVYAPVFDPAEWELSFSSGPCYETRQFSGLQSGRWYVKEYLRKAGTGLSWQHADISTKAESQ